MGNGPGWSDLPNLIRKNPRLEIYQTPLTTKMFDAKQTLSLLAHTYFLKILNLITLYTTENMRNFENSNN